MDKIQQAKLMKSALIDADHLAECTERLLAALNKVAGAEASIDATYPMRRKTSAKRFGCAATFR